MQRKSEGMIDMCKRGENSRRKLLRQNADLFLNRATAPKRKLMLAKSSEIAHKTLELIAPVFFELSRKR